MIAIVDYGVGNLFSLSCSLEYLGFPAKITAEAAELRAAERIILPGVGAFGDAVARLRATGLVPVLEAEVASGKPILGICLGMQLLFEESQEYGRHTGLGWIPGGVYPMEPDLRAMGLDYKVPQMGLEQPRRAPAGKPADEVHKAGGFCVLRTFVLRQDGRALHRRVLGLWRDRAGRGGARQRVRLPVPSRKERRRGAQHPARVL